MKKIGSIALILGLLLLASMLFSPAHAALPAPYSSIKNPYTLTEATIEGGSPVTVDPAAAYDTASGQLLQQVYDTLIFFDGEHMDSYIPVLATSWVLDTVTVTPGTGPANVAYYNRPSYFRYTFKIAPNAPWQDPTYGNVTPADVAYSFKREMIEDYAGGPQWMMNEPLLGYAGGVTGWDIGNATNPGPDAALVGHMLDDSVQFNATHVWLNIAYGPSPGDPGAAYGPELQILCQTWSDVLSENWIKNYVIGTLHQPDWDGTFGADYKGWLAAHFATVTPTSLDYASTDAGALMMGSGPFKLTKLNYAANYWTVDRFPAYFRGWPAPFPVLSGSKPAGYVNEFTVTWNYVWATRSSMFESGDVDFCAVPRQYLPQMYKSSSPPYYPPNYPLDGIRVVAPEPTLDVDGLFFQFNINSATPYGTYVANGTFSEDAMPYDFFGNPTWGIHNRKAFADCIDYTSFISTAYLGEAFQPATAIIPGLYGYDSSVVGYKYDLTAAKAEFQAVPGLWDKGFTITLAYNTGNIPRQTLATLLKTALEGMNPKFHVNIVSVTWHVYITATILGEYPAFIIGWAPDFPDSHDYDAPFYTPSAGAYAAWQDYDNPAMDALVAQGIATPNGPARLAVYTAIQKLAVQDCSFAPTDQPIGRHFERDWVCGYYYSAIYFDIYAYNLWKWYYVPQALSASVVQPQSFQLPYDVNYDAVVDMKDIGIVAKAFGTSYGPPISPRWVYRGDVNNDRTIDMKDIGGVARNFGKKGLLWVPPS